MWPKCWKTLTFFSSFFLSLLQRCKGNEVAKAVFHMRKEPLDAAEVAVAREALKQHGLRWKQIRNHCEGLWKREAHYLGFLWEKHIETCEEDRRLTESLKRAIEEAAAAPRPRGRPRKHAHPSASASDHSGETDDDGEDECSEGGSDVSGAGSGSEYTEEALAEYGGDDADGDDGAPDRDDGGEGAAVGSHQWQKNKWCQEFDRVILLAVRASGAGAQAFYAAWRQLGGRDSPFSEEEISQRYSWLSAKFMEMATQ